MDVMYIEDAMSSIPARLIMTNDLFLMRDLSATVSLVCCTACGYS